MHILQKFKLIPIKEYENYIRCNNLNNDDNQKNIDVTEKATQTEFTQIKHFNEIENQSEKVEEENLFHSTPSPSRSGKIEGENLINSIPASLPPPGTPSLYFKASKSISDKEKENNESNRWIKYWRKSIK